MADPERWGLPLAAVHSLAARLHACWARFGSLFCTRTRDTSGYALHYLKGLLRMERGRTFASIGREAGVPGQNLQHFRSNSPWSAQPVLRQVQAEIAATPGLQGGVLALDESADEKAGPHSAGAGRQHNGRLGKVELSQVGVFLAYVKDGLWTWVDGELFVPEHWFTKAMAEERQRVGLPPERTFATKIALGWRLIERVQAQGVPFQAVTCDTLYGRSTWLRRRLDQAEIRYMAEVPADTQVYLTPPTVGVPPTPPDHKGRPFTRPRVLSAEQPVEVRTLVDQPDTVWQRVPVRSTERGCLEDAFAARRVWTTHEGEPPRAEWLVLRRAEDDELSYALSNAPADVALAELAWLKCQRAFIECSNQEAKRELGWDEFQAQKYRAWEHQLALTVLASWFVAQTRWAWRHQAARDPALALQLDVDLLPALSVANVRALLRAVLPLRQFTPDQAAALVVEHLVNRTRKRKSWLKRRHQAQAPP